MKESLSRIQMELLPIVLVLFSFIPLMLIGFMVDVLLTQFFSVARGNLSGLSDVSLWVYRHLAGDRFLPQGIMACFWLLMILSFLIQLYTRHDPHRFRVRFLYSFLLIWGAAFSVVGGIVLACIKPFDLLLARVDTPTGIGEILQTVLIAELSVILLLPVFQYVRRRGKGETSIAPLPPLTDTPKTDVTSSAE